MWPKIWPGKQRVPSKVNSLHFIQLENFVILENVSFSVYYIQVEKWQVYVGE